MVEAPAHFSVVSTAFRTALLSWLPLSPCAQPEGTESSSSTSTFCSSRTEHNILLSCPYVCVASAAHPLPVHRFKEDALVDMDCDDAEEGADPEDGDLNGLVQEGLGTLHLKKKGKSDGSLEEAEDVCCQDLQGDKKHTQAGEKASKDSSLVDGGVENRPIISDRTLASVSSTLNAFFSSPGFIASESVSNADRIEIFPSNAGHASPQLLKEASSSSKPAETASGTEMYSPASLPCDSSAKLTTREDPLKSPALSVSSTSSLCNPSAAVSSLSSVSEFSKLWLQSTLQKLQLPPVPAETVPLGSFSAALLQAEKKRLKSELRNFDAEFSRTYGRDITREDKECVRSLYAYYQKVKKHLHKLQQNKSAEPGKTVTNISGSHNENLSWNVNKKPCSTPSLDLSTSASSFLYPAVPSRGSFDASQAPSSFCLSASILSKPGITPSDYQKGSAAGAPLSSLSSKRLLYTADLPSSALFSSSIYHPVKSASASNTCVTNEFSEELMRLQRLRDAKRALRERLVAYQAKFREANGRPVKLYKDIAPIEREYSQYKKLKGEINSCMEKLGIPNLNDKSEAKKQSQRSCK